ncbi:MAG: thioredoxin family protein [Alicyclobacillus sp.]|nr:thioredoxin family protein [Alicyclobacillus sp.]
MNSVSSIEQFVEAIRSPQRTVLLFSADWCPDCRFLDQFIDDVAEAHARDFTFLKVDRDQFPELCETYDILGIPSLLVFRDGAVVGRFVSKLRKTRAEVEDFLARVLEQEAVHG